MYPIPPGKGPATAWFWRADLRRCSHARTEISGGVSAGMMQIPDRRRRRPFGVGWPGWAI